LCFLQLFLDASLDAKHNHWRRVFDFNKGEAAIPEPHWVIMGESAEPIELGAAQSVALLHFTLVPCIALPWIADPAGHKPWRIEVDEQPEPVNPVPIDADAEDASAGALLGGVMAFDIKSTSQDAAQAKLLG
jgi:hypothetical protein